MITGNESVSVLKIVFLIGLIGSVVALKFVPTKPYESINRTKSTSLRQPGTQKP